MRSKRPSRFVEWGKSLLILLLCVSLLYLLGRTQLSGEIRAGVKGLFDKSSEENPSAVLDQVASVRVNPVRLAVCQDGQRYGVQYDQEKVDADFSVLSILFTEALSSVGEPEVISEQAWRSALCRTGIYVDFYYAVPMDILSDWLGDEQEMTVLTGSARRICLAADSDGGVSLFYKNEQNGSFYACATTLSRDFHLDDAVADWLPNGAQFAFEVEGMDAVDAYTLLTVTPQPVVYTAGNPLLEDSDRVDELLSALDFPARGGGLNPATGGQLGEGNDSLRLSEDGVITFHTIGNAESGARFTIGEPGTAAMMDYVQTLAQETAGAWCGQARLCLSQIEQAGEQTVITFQYFLNGSPVTLPEGAEAARFVIRDGTITDFTLYLRAYTGTEETSLVLPAAQAEAAMEAIGVYGKELTLVYQDSGVEQVSVNWAAI